MNKVTIVGIGPGAKEYITPVALIAVIECDILIGGKRNLQLFQHLSKTVYEFTADMEGLIQFVDRHRKEQRICVIVSGDPGYYSLLDFFLKHLGEEALAVIPGISSFQYLFAVLKKPWKNYNLESLHGRSVEFIGQLEEKSGVFLLTDRVHTPRKIAEELIQRGYRDCKMIIGENLSYDDERISIESPDSVQRKGYSDLCVVVIEK